MKLHLPNNLRKLLLTCGVIATTASATTLDEWEWDPIWFELQGSKKAPDPKDVKELKTPKKEGFYYTYAALSDDKYEDFRSSDENGNYVAAYIDWNDGWIEWENRWRELRGNETDLCGGLGSIEDDEQYVNTNVWMYIAGGGAYGSITGGNSDIEFSIHNGSRSGFMGDTHILIGEKAHVEKVVGGNFRDTEDRNDHVNIKSSPTFSTFIGNSYLSVHADADDYIIGGSQYFRNSQRVLNHEGILSLFDGNSYVNVYNLQSAYIKFNEEGITMKAARGFSWLKRGDLAPDEYPGVDSDVLTLLINKTYLHTRGNN